MPIYEFACPDCRKIFSFLSKRLRPQGLPSCPKCGNKNLLKQLSPFAAPRRAKEPAPAAEAPGPAEPMPEADDPRLTRAMAEMERDLQHIDENNPRHMAHFMKKMKDLMPAGSTPKELDIAIKRLEAGEDPEKIEQDMGDVLSGLMGGEEEGSPGGPYTRDSGLYDY